MIKVQCAALIGVNPDDGLPKLARKAIEKQDMSVELLVESAEGPVATVGKCR